MLARLILLLGALLMGLALPGGTAPALAHGSHQPVPASHADHALGGPASHAQHDKAMTQGGLCTAESACALAGNAGHHPQSPDHTGCCCHGLLCQAGATTMSETDIVVWSDGAAFDLPPVLASAKHVPATIERPPRV
jgi:hypothetical protein